MHALHTLFALCCLTAVHAELGGVGQVHTECRREGLIAFTFDQGPSTHTGVLLGALAAAGVRATFHVVPDYLENPVLSANLRRTAADGHLVGLFVPEAWGCPATDAEAETAGLRAYLQNATRRVQTYTGYAPTFLRFAAPGPTPAALKVATSLGMRISSYNLDSQDYAHSASETGSKRQRASTDACPTGPIFENIRSTLDMIVPPTLGSFIVVQRDILLPSVQQTAAIVRFAKDKGYKAVRLDECIGALDVRGDRTPADGHAEALDSPRVSSAAPMLTRRTALFLQTLVFVCLLL